MCAGAVVDMSRTTYVLGGKDVASMSGRVSGRVGYISGARGSLRELSGAMDRGHSGLSIGPGLVQF